MNLLSTSKGFDFLLPIRQEHTSQFSEPDPELYESEGFHSYIFDDLPSRLADDVERCPVMDEEFFLMESIDDIELNLKAEKLFDMDAEYTQSITSSPIINNAKNSNKEVTSICEEKNLQPKKKRKNEKTSIFKYDQLRTLKQMKSDDKYLKEDEAASEVEQKNLGIVFKRTKATTFVNEDRYYSRLNSKELAAILGLSNYKITLTNEIEKNILTIFERLCNFKLGYQTWIRDTDKVTREQYINKLYEYTYPLYPEINKSQLEIIVRRGSYYRMQHRLRNKRRNKRRYETIGQS